MDRGTAGQSDSNIPPGIYTGGYKRPVISSLNDLRPVALTFAMMKVCERVVLCKLGSLVKGYTDC